MTSQLGTLHFCKSTSAWLAPRRPVRDNERTFQVACHKILSRSFVRPMMAAIMRAARRRGMLGVIRCGAGSSSRVRAHAPSVQNFAAVINVACTRFKADKNIMDALVHLRKKTGAGRRNRRKVSPGDIAVGHALRRLRHVTTVCVPLRYAALSPPQLPD